MGRVPHEVDINGFGIGRGRVEAMCLGSSVSGVLVYPMAGNDDKSSLQSWKRLRQIKRRLAYRPLPPNRFRFRWHPEASMATASAHMAAIRRGAHSNGAASPCVGGPKVRPISLCRRACKMLSFVLQD